MKNSKLLLLTVVLLLTLTGCRTRTTVPVDPIPDENGETAEDDICRRSNDSATGTDRSC